MNTSYVKQLEIQKSQISTPQKLQNQEKQNERLMIQGNRAANQSQEQGIQKQSNIRSRILSASNYVQDAKNIMQNAQIRMLMEEYDTKFNPNNKRIRPLIRDPYLSRSQSSVISSIGATLNSQSQQGIIDLNKGDQILEKNDQNMFIDRLQELVANYQQNEIIQDENKERQLNLPTISSKIVNKISHQINKINQGIQQESKESLYTAQKAFTQSTMNTDQNYQKQKNIFQTDIKQQKQRSQSFQRRSFSEKKLARVDSSDLYDNEKQILERETNNSINFTQLNDTTAAFILTSPSEKKINSSKKKIMRPKNLDFIQNLSNYTSQNWTELLHQRINNLDYQNASKDIAARGRQLIKVFESFIINEVKQCSQEEIEMSNSLVLNEVCKHLEDMQYYNDTLLKKVNDNKKEKEEHEIIELFGYCMKFNNPEHSDEFVQELKSFFERKYLNIIKKLRMNGNSSTQQFIDTLQNCEVFFKLYKDKLMFTKQKVDSLTQELEEAQKLIKALEERAQTQHLARDRIEIEYRVKSREDFLEIQNRYELLYDQKVEESKNQIKKLELHIETLKEEIKSKDLQIEKNQVEFEKYQKSINKKKVDASTQIQLHIMPYVQNQQQSKAIPQQEVLSQNPPQSQSSSNPFSSFGNEFMSPFTFSKSCSGAFISLILTECVFYDFSLFYRHKFCSFYASQSYNHLVNFTHYFFITKFGNKVIGEIFLKNFVLSLQEYSQEGILRFIIFSQLTGLDLSQQAPNTQQTQQNKNNLNRSTMSQNSVSSQMHSQQTFQQFVKKIFWESKQSYIIYMRIAILFRKSLLKHTNSQQHIMSGIYSLFDNTELLNKIGQTEGYENASILISRVQPIIQEIIDDHLSKSDNIDDVYKRFQSYIKTSNKQKQKSPQKQVHIEENDDDEDEEKVQSSPSKIIKGKTKNQNQNKQNSSGLRVTMDQIAFFIIEFLAELKSEQLDHFIAGIKSIQNKKRTVNISIKDFTETFNVYFAYSPFISDSNSFTEDLFRKFIMNSTTALSGGEDQKKQALKPFLLALFDEFNEYESQNLSFYLSTGYLSQQAQLNLEKVFPQNKQQQLIAPKLHTSQSSRLIKTQDGKRSNSSHKKLIDGNTQSQKNLLSDIPIQLTTEQQVIQILQEDIFDVPNNIVSIFESYEQIKPLVKSEETLDERIKMENEKFKSLLQQLNKIKYELKQSSENNPTTSFQPRKSYIDTVKLVQQNLNNLMIMATSKLKLSVNF